MRHRDNCLVRKTKIRKAEQQTKLNFQWADDHFPTVPALHTGNFDIENNEGGCCTLDLDARASLHNLGGRGIQPHDETWLSGVLKDLSGDS